MDTKVVTFVLSMVFVTGIDAQTPAAPTSLIAKSATSAQVQLSWSGNSAAKTYSVQRKTSGDYATIGSVAATAATDTTIDPYTTYTYRIVAVNDSGQSGASNEITVGPPPYGFNLVAPAHNLEHAGNFGYGVRMILDGNGDPAFSYYIYDPFDEGYADNNTLYFQSWSRPFYQWNQPVKIAVIGGIGSDIGSSLARDPDTNMLAIAYEVGLRNQDSRIDIATSTDAGVTWKMQTVVSDPVYVLSYPALGMAKGQVHLAYYDGDQDNSNLYVTGSVTAPAATWKTQKIPLAGGYSKVTGALSLAMDAAGNPGVAYVAENDASSGTVFWRPGGSAVVIADNNGYAGDNDVNLTFYGIKPRVVLSGQRGMEYNEDSDHQIWVALSPDTGGSWLPPVNVPTDGDQSQVPPVWLAVGSQGQAAITSQNDGGVFHDCGLPKLARSDDSVNFRTCGLTGADQANISDDFPVVRFGGNDKMWVSFRNSVPEGDLPAGIILWREQ